MAFVAVFAVSAVGCTMQSGSTSSTAGSTEGATESAVQNGQQKLDFAKLAPATLDAKFDRWLVSPGGRVGGMLLDDGSVVRMHHVKDTSSLSKGDAVHVEGKTFPEKQGVKTIAFAEVKKYGAVVFAAPKLAEKGKHEGGRHHEKGEKHGKKHEGKKELSAMSADGTVEAVIPHGFVLSDGTFVYAPHKADLASLAVKKGDAIKVSGKGGSYELGKAMVIDSITANGKTTAL
ncbi:MAG: hypothetical protein ACXVEF_44075 [Polyangiales bacterium]